MSNPFALLEIDDEPKVQQKKAAPKAAAKAAPKQAAAPKKDAKVVAQGTQKPSLQSGQRDRHTKGGRSEGENNTKRPYDRSLNRQTKGQTERKGQDRQVKGGWAAKDPKADQVAADVDQKKDEEAKKAEEEVAAPVEEAPKVVVPEEPQPFLLADALKQKQKVVGERTKPRAAVEQGAVGQTLNAGQKPSSTVQSIRKGQSKIDATKKVFSVDEFLVVTGGAEKVQQQEQRQFKKRPNRADFPAL